MNIRLNEYNDLILEATGSIDADILYKLSQEMKEKNIQHLLFPAVERFRQDVRLRVPLSLDNSKG